MLPNVLMYDAAKAHAYLSHFRLWDQTLIASTAWRGHIKYPTLNKSEDREFTHLLMTEIKIYPTVSHNLYIYVYHGNNSWDQDHFNWLFGHAQPMSQPITQIISDVLSEKYSVSEASDLLESDDLMREINYFHGEKEIVQQQKQEADLLG